MSTRVRAYEHYFSIISQTIIIHARQALVVVVLNYFRTPMNYTAVVLLSRPLYEIKFYESLSLTVGRRMFMYKMVLKDIACSVPINEIIIPRRVAESSVRN